MTLRVYLPLAILALGIGCLVASYEKAPGYMDADYYYAGGAQLAYGFGFSERVLWNYLDDPVGLPHPSHGYWMPGASILAALGMALFGKIEFSSARFGFLLLFACLPLLTANLAYSFSHQRKAAWLAGLLAIFSSFYLPYLTTIDTFTLYACLGALFLLVIGKLTPTILPQKTPSGSTWLSPSSLPLAVIIFVPFFSGVLAGMMHLTRADGIIWFGVALLVSTLGLPRHNKKNWPFNIVGFLLCWLGYLLVMGPWMARNLAVFGTFLSPGNWRALWITQYNDLYVYPTSLLTFSRWWSQGLASILNTRLAALGQHVQTMIAIQGQIFLAPLIVWGLWQLRRDIRVQMGLLAWMITFLLMTVVFPYQGSRGGFFHSAAALQPLFWAAVPVGLEAFVEWGTQRRGWQLRSARRMFQIGIIFLAFALTLLVVPRRLIGGDTANPAWQESAVHYAALGKALKTLGAGQEDIVMVNNPPGFYNSSDRPAIVIPHGGINALLGAASKYQARYLLLEYDQIIDKPELYSEPRNYPSLIYLMNVDGTRIYLIEQKY